MDVVIPLADLFGEDGSLVEENDGWVVRFPVDRLDSVRTKFKASVEQMDTWAARDRMANARAAKATGRKPRKARTPRKPRQPRKARSPRKARTPRIAAVT